MKNKDYCTRSCRDRENSTNPHSKLTKDAKEGWQLIRGLFLKRIKPTIEEGIKKKRRIRNREKRVMIMKKKEIDDERNRYIEFEERKNKEIADERNRYVEERKKEINYHDDIDAKKITDMKGIIKSMRKIRLITVM